MYLGILSQCNRSVLLDFLVIGYVQADLYVAVLWQSLWSWQGKHTAYHAALANLHSSIGCSFMWHKDQKSACALVLAIAQTS